MEKCLCEIIVSFEQLLYSRIFSFNLNSFRYDGKAVELKNTTFSYAPYPFIPSLFCYLEFPNFLLPNLVREFYILSLNEIVETWRRHCLTEDIVKLHFTFEGTLGIGKSSQAFYFIREILATQPNIVFFFCKLFVI
jgi:hypothetical protein